MKTLRKLCQVTMLLLAVLHGMARATITNTDQGHKQRKSGVTLAILLILSVLVALLVTTSGVSADNGDFSIDFAAAAPQSYDHRTGGGAFDDRTIGVGNDVVESLEGGDFSCGDIVTYFVEVTVDDVQTADTDAPQTIEMDFSFLADTTGQSGVAIGDIMLVRVNYNEIKDLITGENSVDDGIVDDGGSTATLTNEHLAGSLFTPKSELHGTVKLDDLERAERVVVRIDVKLFCDPGITKKPTGNLQAALTDTRLTFVNGAEPRGPPEAIPSGKQTIPLKHIGDICTPELNIKKTVTTACGSCPGSETLTITAGDTVKYCYVITNPGSCASLYNVKVVDDNGTSGTGDDFTVMISTGLSDEDGDGFNDDLSAGGTATGEATVTLNKAGTVTNIATATGNDSIIKPTTLEDSDSATVIVKVPPKPPTPVIEVTKTADPTSVPETGGDVKFSIRVINKGLENITIDSLSDTDFDLSVQCPNAQGTLLQPGETYTCRFTEFITGNMGENHVNTVNVVASDDDGNTATDSDTATVKFTPTPPVAPTPTQPITPILVPTMTSIGTILLAGLLGLIGAGAIMRRH
ncbi:MAG: hypothetical protein EF813_12005 [Methanosarcinales archaeon]|nr:MAG: hypothetical protein EF813_12005 [Methanosarcinales archaeon]